VIISGLMKLAKPAIDVGLMTNSLDAHDALLSELGIRYDHLLKIGGGVHQHRYECGQSVIKVNSSRPTLDPGPTGYTRLRLAADVTRPEVHRTPDDVEIVAVPAGHDGIDGVEVTWSTSDPAEAERFLVDGFGAIAVEGRFAIGESFLIVEHDPDQPRTGNRDGLGLRYLTVQVTDVESAHHHMLKLGFTEGSPPVRLGDTAYISFVRDHDGNWVELSQRASLTGPLPDVPPDRHLSG
jgi:hypothetical protein